MKNRSTYLIATFCFLLGCMLSMSVVYNAVCEYPITSTERQQSLHETGRKESMLVVLIFSNPDNTDKRDAIRNTWLQLKNGKSDGGKREWRHYFAVGISSLTEKARERLRREQTMYEDMLILPQLKDHYYTLSEKLLLSMKWLQENHHGLQYLLKCDDDTFVRIDLILQEVKVLRQKALESAKSSVMYSAAGGKFEKEQTLPSVGLYWGYFKGNARVKQTGRWAETDFFLCDRYLPYALGGGYVLSADIVHFITTNSHYLQLFKSEDVSVGVWTASLSRVFRFHDIRFDTEWSSRGCADSFLIRHKQSPEDMRDMYSLLMETQNKKLCRVPIVSRHSYQYNWTVAPSQCCKVAS